MNSKQTLWSKILWVVAGIGFLIGLIGLVNRMSTGHTNLLLSFQPQNKSMVVLSALLITLTALDSKLNLVIPALAQKELDGLAAAFSGPGLSFNYLPTATEWGVLLWTISLGVIIIFLLGSQMLPRLTKEVK